MNKKIVITRPLDKSLAFIGGASHETGMSHSDFLVSPLLEIAHKDVRISDPELYDALIITSANALHVLKGRDQWLAKPVYIVGFNSAQLYKEIGGCGALSVFETAKQMSRELAKRKGGFFLYLRGADTSLDLQVIEGISVKEKICYKAKQVEALSVDVRGALKNKDIHSFLLFSKRTAEALGRIIEGQDLSDEILSVKFLCMSGHVAGGLSQSLSDRIHVAKQPNEQGMIDLVRSTVVG